MPLKPSDTALLTLPAGAAGSSDVHKSTSQRFPWMQTANGQGSAAVRAWCQGAGLYMLRTFSLRHTAGWQGPTLNNLCSCTGIYWCADDLLTTVVVSLRGVGHACRCHPRGHDVIERQCATRYSLSGMSSYHIESRLQRTHWHVYIQVPTWSHLTQLEILEILDSMFCCFTRYNLNTCVKTTLAIS